MPARRVADLREAGVADARLYGEDPHDGVGGDGAFFLLLDEPGNEEFDTLVNTVAAGLRELDRVRNAFVRRP